MKILAFGEILWDVIEDQKHIGGAPLNFAAHFVKCGGRSAIISRVGKDQNGTEAIEQVNSVGIDTRYVQFDDDHMTGVVNVKLQDGFPTYTIERDVAYDFIGPADILEEAYDAFYFGSLAQRNTISQNSLQHILKKNKFDQIFYDVNLREGHYLKEVIEPSLKMCTILKLNDEEVITLSEMFYQSNLSTDQFIQRITSDHPKIELVIVTEGAKGCIIYKGVEKFRAESEKVKVKDTVGAGDSFSAAFVHTYLTTNNPERAAFVANKVGGFVASCNGAVPDYTPEIKALFE